MTRSYRAVSAAVVCGLCLSTPASIWADEPAVDDLRRQIEQLQSKVEQLEAKQRAHQQSLESREVDAVLERVLLDARQRSQLLQVEGFTAGWDDGFKIRSADGTFLINPYFQLQFRHTTNFTDGPAIFANGQIVGFDDDDDIENGFEVRRMKLGFRGNAFTVKLTYDFRWTTRSSGGDVRLENALVQYEFADNWAFRLGQWKDDWTHEETVSSARQLAVDRSLLNELLGGGPTDFVQGVMVLYKPSDGAFRANAAFHGGANSDNTDWLRREWGASARAEYKLHGNWRAYDDFTARGNKEDLLVLGGGLNFTQSGSDDVWFHTVDLQWENTAGLALYGAYVGQWIDTADADLYNWGMLAQAGYMLTDKWEVFGRYDYTRFDLGTVTGGNDFSEYAIGVNYYLKGHAAKFTIDLSWLPDGAPQDVRGIGVLTSNDDQFIVRAQFQLLL